jgi:predicted O-methyltransferase YrrM
MRACIEPREVDAVEGLRTALEGGELYDAALIDSLHTTEQVWAEFEVVRRLVRPGGLILFHDVGLPPPHGGVEEALLRVEAAGYGVTRLFLAEGSIAEEERLGLGLVENRLRKGAAE